MYTKNSNRKWHVNTGMGGCQIRLRLQLHVGRVIIDIYGVMLR